MSDRKYVFAYDKDYAERVTTNFQTFLNNDLYIDLIFVCRNNKKVGAHQVVLGCLSKFFYSIFVDNVNTIKEKVLHIYVPDIRAKMMKHILQFIYSGKAVLNREELQEFNEDIKLLGMPLDHFSTPSEATENNEIPTAEKPLRNRALRIVRDTVDLTDTNINEDVKEVNGNCNNIDKSSSRETSAEATVPAALPTASDADTNNIPTPPIVDKQLIDKNPSAKSSEAENGTKSSSSNNRSDVTKGKLSKSSKPENLTTSTSLNSSSNVAMGNHELENRTTLTSLRSGSVETMVPENNIVKSEATVPNVPETNEKMIRDRKKKRSKNAPLLSKRGKYLTASIDLASDDDDVITIS